MNYGDGANERISPIAEKAPRQFGCGWKLVLRRQKPKKKRHAEACAENQNELDTS
jgi:hypothetical protein